MSNYQKAILCNFNYHGISYHGIVKHVDLSSVCVCFFCSVVFRVHQTWMCTWNNRYHSPLVVSALSDVLSTQMMTQIKAHEEMRRITPNDSRIIWWSVETATIKTRWRSLPKHWSQRWRKHHMPWVDGIFCRKWWCYDISLFLNHHVGMFETSVPIIIFEINCYFRAIPLFRHPQNIYTQC